MKYSKIEGHPDLRRDTTTNAIMNTNQNAYETYLAMSQVKQEEKNKVDSLERDLDAIKDEISQVKTLIQDLINASR